jgi:putative DNA modification/repair radical SAM protein
MGAAMESNFILSTNRKPVSGIMCIDSDANTGITVASDPEPQIQVKMNQKMSLMEKLGILSDAAKYDVSCSSSGVSRRGDGTGIGNTVAGGICHSFGADGRCISLLKVLFTNECIYDCKYCINRRSNDVPRASFTPDEICDLTIQFYRRNYIEGLFLSSGILYSPSYTMELIYEAVHKLRTKYRFQGYIHVKAIPGADPELVKRLGLLADRMSVNLELPTADGLKSLAPNKHRKNILTPMRQIQQGITQNKNEIVAFRHAPSFVPAGQSTQMIVGATPESDYQIMMVAENLYKKFDLKRVYYSAFVSVNADKSLPALPGGPPLLREHRLYQADWLLRFYGFEAQELLSEGKPNFNVLLDPKADWALRHLEQFPVEINRASYQTILRVPGIGVKSARRIVRARRNGSLNFDDLKKIGVTLKRALYFITCSGKMMYPTKLDEDYIARNLVGEKERLPFDRDGMTYKQLSLFDDTGEFSFRQAAGG